MKTTKKDIILGALRRAGAKGIHSFHLNLLAKTTRTAARINDLKNEGYIINAIPHVKMGNADGAVYILISEPKEIRIKTIPVYNDETRTVRIIEVKTEQLSLI